MLPAVLLTSRDCNLSKIHSYPNTSITQNVEFAVFLAREIKPATNSSLSVGRVLYSLQPQPGPSRVIEALR